MLWKLLWKPANNWVTLNPTNLFGVGCKTHSIKHEWNHQRAAVCIHLTCDEAQPNSPPSRHWRAPNHWQCAPTCQHGRECLHRWTVRSVHQLRRHRRFRRLGSDGPKWHASHATSLGWPQSLAACAWARPPPDECGPPAWRRRGSTSRSAWGSPPPPPRPSSQALALAPGRPWARRKAWHPRNTGHFGGDNPRWDSDHPTPWSMPLAPAAVHTNYSVPFGSWA